MLDETEGRRGEVMFLSVCHADATSGRGAALLDTGLGYGERETFEKEPPSWPASSQPSVRIPLSLSLQWPRCVSLISCTIFHRCADGKERRKGETSVGWGERQTNQFERPDKCNKVKVYFRAPSKWVLRYYITLFIQAPSLNYSVCAHAMCVNVCPSTPVRTCPCLAL